MDESGTERQSRRSLASDADDVDYGRMSILDTTGVSKQGASRKDKDIKKKLEANSKTTGACCNTKCFIF